MALTTTSNRVVATGDGATTVFPFNRLLYDATHLQVYLAGVLQSSGYTVSGVPGSSTSVTFSVAPGSGVQVLLLRVVPLTQLSVYAVGGAFPAATTEKNLDLLMMANQQFDEILDRAITLPVTSTLTAANLPDPALAANYGKGVKIAGDGSGLDTFNINAGNISGVVTTKGDIHIFGASAEDRLPVGTDNFVLTAHSAQAKGLLWTNNLAGINLANASITTNPLTLSSGGIAFPATQVPSADANTLDDYEEGSWTPSLGGTTTYNSQIGTYVKIGKAVHINCFLNINALGTGSTSVISGLPFTAAAGLNSVIAVGESFTLATAVVSLRARVTAGGTQITLAGRTAASVSSDTTTNLFGNSSRIELSGTYYV